MALKVKELDCPNCGASLSAKNARKAKVLVCDNCGSEIDLTSPEYEIIGKAILGSAPPRSPIRLGQVATFDGVKWQVVGRVRYRDEVYWDEWLLMSEAGKYQWLVESAREFTLYQPFVPTNPVDPNSVGASIDLEGITAKVGEKSVAAIEYVEGELTWKARVGDRMNYLDAEHAGGVYSIEWSEREIEFFKGQEISRSAVYKAFGFEKKAASPARLAGRRVAAGGGATSGVAVIIALIVIFVILCICCSMCGCLPAGSGGGGTPSIRIGAPSGGGGFSGGGFSGGK